MPRTTTVPTSALPTPPATAPVDQPGRAARLAPWASLGGRLLLAGVLGYAALTKIADPDATVRSVQAYQLLPDGLATFVGRGLPTLELVLAALLLAGLALRLAASVTAVLLAVFIAGIASAAARGLAIDCGCFGSGGPTDDPAYTGEIVRDVLLLAVAVGVALAGRSALALQPRTPQAPSSDAAGPRGQARSERLRHEKALTAHRARTRLLSLVAVALLVVGPLAAVVVAEAAEPAPAAAVPASATAEGGLVVGDPAAPKVLEVFEDPQCPWCGRLETSPSAQVIADAVDRGEVQVVYRLRSFLGAESVRAVAALAAAADEGRFAELHAVLFANQPAEGAGGYTVDQLLQLGRGVGLTSERFVRAVEEQTYAPWAGEIDGRAARDGNTTTPEVRLDGRVLDMDTVFDPDALGEALR